MDTNFDEIFGDWQNQYFETLCPEINSCSESGVTSFLDDIIDVKESVTLASCPSNLEPSSSVVFSTRANAPSVSSPLWALQTPVSVAYIQNDVSSVTDKLLDQVVPSPELISPMSTSSPGSVKICINSGLKRQLQPLIAEQSSSPSKRKKLNPASQSQIAPKTKELFKAFKQSVGSRIPTPEEHILRERKRRLDMASKFQVLESILPAGIKREKAVVVEDAIKLVKMLQLRKEELLKRRSNLKLELLIQSSEAPRYRRQSKTCPVPRKAGDKKFDAIQSNQPKHIIYKGGDLLKQIPPIVDRGKPINTAWMTGNPQNLIVPTSVHHNTAANRDIISPENLRIHAQVSEEEILVEIFLHRYPFNLQIRLFQSMESLKLDVVRCSILRLPFEFVECFIVAKPYVDSITWRLHEVRTAASVLIEALQANFKRV